MYELRIPAEVQAQINALSDDAANALFDVLLDHVRNVPWDGQPEHEDNPDGAVRRWLFGPCGAGFVVYLIVERERDEVHLLKVLWVG